MLAEKVRHLFVRTLALALAAGLVTHSMPAGNFAAKAADMTVAMSMDTAPDVPMQGKCDGCAGDENGLMSSACSAFCGSAITLPSPPVLLDATAIAIPLPPAGTVVTGHTGPPDPYPPRPTSIS
jgi:hypothetical protein